MRLGGIYALEGVMNTSKQYSVPVLEALCAFVRDGTKSLTREEYLPATDIQAVLTVIGRRKEGPDGVNLSGAQVTKANLRSANLTSADLSGAYLTDTNLTDANLIAADLSGAYLTHVELDQACGTGREAASGPDPQSVPALMAPPLNPSGTP